MKDVLAKSMTAILAFFTPIYGLLISVGLVIILDIVSGVIKVFRTNEEFNPKGLSSLVSKIVLYQSAILLLFPIDHYLLNELVQLHYSTTYLFTKLCAVVLILIELTSIKENVEDALGVNFWLMYKNGLKRAKDVKGDINDLKK